MQIYVLYICYLNKHKQEAQRGSNVLPMRKLCVALFAGFSKGLITASVG